MLPRSGPGSFGKETAARAVEKEQAVCRMVSFLQRPRPSGARKAEEVEAEEAVGPACPRRLLKFDLRGPLRQVVGVVHAIQGHGGHLPSARGSLRSYASSPWLA